MGIVSTSLLNGNAIKIELNMICYYCEQPITSKNRSIEHIIPNAIGGRLKSKKLLCISCNSELGNRLDGSLCQALLPLSSFLNIKRETGKTPDLKNLISTDGKRYDLIGGINPVLVAPEIKISENKINVVARNEKELRHILKKLKIKHPNLDITNIEEKFDRQNIYMKGSLHMNINVGDDDFYAALLKMAINFWIHNKGGHQCVQDAIERLRNGKSLYPGVINHYYPIDSMDYSSEIEVAHTIVIKGDNIKKLLFGYIELFSSFAYTINLNTDYIGPEIEFSYSFDVLTCNVIESKINLDYKGNIDVHDVQLNKDFVNRLNTKLNRVFAIADKRQIDVISKSKIKEAIRKSFKDIPPEARFTKEMLGHVSHTIAVEMAPFLLHLENRKIKTGNQQSSDNNDSLAE